MSQGLLILLTLLRFCPIASAEGSWERLHGGPKDDRGDCVRRTTDGGFINTGIRDTIACNRKVWLLKTDAVGEETWPAGTLHGTNVTTRRF